MWRVKASRVKKPHSDEEEDDFERAITTPKLTELENTQHLRYAQRQDSNICSIFTGL